MSGRWLELRRRRAGRRAQRMVLVAGHARWLVLVGPLLLAWCAARAEGQTVVSGESEHDALLDPGPLPAAPEAISLEQALAIADREAVDLEIARIQVQRSEAAERIAWAGLLPAVTGSLNYQRFDQAIVRSTTTTGPDGVERTDQLVVRDVNSLQGALTVSETLSLRAYGALRVAEATSDVFRVELEDLRRRAHAAIARTFFTVLAARHAAELARSQIDDARRQLRAARIRAELGAAIGLDVARAEVAALDAGRRAADADAALMRTWDQLGDALGRAEPIDAAPSRLGELPHDEDEAIERASRTRTDVRRAEATREVAGRLVDEAWFRFVPSLTLSWTGSFTEPRTAFNPNTQWIAGATLSVPFYDGGARYGALRDAELGVSEADTRLDAVRRLVRLEIRDAMRRVQTAERSIAIADRQVDVARRAAEAAESGFGAGSISGLELDSARRALEQAELQQILAVLEHENARVDLLAATGDL